MLLLVSLQRRLGKLYPLTPRTLRRCTLGTNGIEVASRRYGLRVSNGISTRRRSGEATVKGVDRSIQLQLRAILQSISIGDDVEDSALQLSDCFDLIAFLLRELGRRSRISIALTLETSATNLIEACRFSSRLLATITLSSSQSSLQPFTPLGGYEGVDMIQLRLRQTTIREDSGFTDSTRCEDTLHELLGRL